MTESKFIPSPAQLDFFEWVKTGRGNCVLEAVAGAGKTTTLVEAISMMPGRVWFGVYNKKMADEIKNKTSKRPEIAARPFPRETVFTSTFHSQGMSIIRRHNGRDAVTDVDDRKVMNIIDALIMEREGAEQQPRDDLKSVRPAIRAVVSMAKNRGFMKPTRGRSVPAGMTNSDDTDAWIEMIEHFDLIDDLPEDVSMDILVKFSRAVLCRNNKDTNVIDYDDMVYLPLALDMKCYDHDWVIVDEAQDTNPTRRALARKLLARNGRLVAVGDPHQAIFGFTGADNDALEQIVENFGCSKLPLTVTYRCPKAVVEHAQKWVSHITAHETAPDGAVHELDFSKLVPEIKEIPADEHREVAILCRYNKHLVSLCFSLIRDGVAARIEGRAIGEGLKKLATRWKSAKTINGLETKLGQYLEREVKKAMDKQQEDRADRVTDRVETLLVIMDRARSQGIDRVSDLSDMIDDMFADNVGDSGIITLCSAHKSKGLEWNRVYILGREQFMPSKFARQSWQVAQEMNLIYVAVTRAKEVLVEVKGVPEAKKTPLEEQNA